MDYRQQSRRPSTPSKQTDRDKAQALRDWIDAALAHYANKGGTRGIVVRRSPPPGEPPASLDAHNEGAPLAALGVEAEEPPRKVRIAE
jgi:hypothetical protein